VQFTQVSISPSAGEGETRGWRINEVNKMEENPSCSNWWRDNEVRAYLGDVLVWTGVSLRDAESEQLTGTV